MAAGATVDPRSLILSQFSDSPNFLQLASDSFVMERGPRYKAYADLRESKLRRMQTMKKSLPPPSPPPCDLTPPRKQIKFQGSFPVTPPNRKTGSSSSALAQSVPDFSKVLRKENRKPPPSSAAAMLSPVMEKSGTPPTGKSYTKLAAAKLGKSKSVSSSGEKRTGLLMARKSYASVEELKGLSAAAANAINGENRGSGRTIANSRGVGKNVLGFRQYY